MGMGMTTELGLISGYACQDIGSESTFTEISDLHFYQKPDPDLRAEAYLSVCCSFSFVSKDDVGVGQHGHHLRHKYFLEHTSFNKLGQNRAGAGPAPHCLGVARLIYILR